MVGSVWIQSPGRVAAFGMALAGLMIPMGMRPADLAFPGGQSAGCASSWGEAPSPKDPASDVWNSVAAISSSNAWAVGTSPVAAGNRATAAEWTGRSWATTQTPDPGTKADDLLGVSGSSASDAWAVGYQEARGSKWQQTLAMHWDGSTWSTVPAPNVGTKNNVLTAVASSGPSDVWAVGIYYASNSRVDTLTEHWDG